MKRKDTEEYLKQWEDIINSVDKTDIPIRFVNRIIFDSEHFKLNANSDENEINVVEMRAFGYPDEAIQEIVNEVLREIEEYSGTMDFLLNIPSVAETAQKNTNQYLKRI